MECRGSPALVNVLPFGPMGLPGSSECSLDVPSDGGLAVEAAPKPAVCGGTDVGSRFGCSSFGFLPSAMKLPTTTCKTEGLNSCNRRHWRPYLEHLLNGNEG